MCETVFLKRSQKKFCSPDCSVAYIHRKKGDFITSWLRGEEGGGIASTGELKRFIKDYLLEQADHRCSACGWGQVHSITGRVPLHIDHIDGNYKNNHHRNLRVLCPNCHALTLNKGNGRTYRIDRMNRNTLP